MKPSSRPAGVSLIAAFFVFVGLLFLMLAPFGRLLSLDLATGLSAGALGTLLAGGGLLCFLIAWGLWCLRPWGRWLALGLALLLSASSLLSMARWLRAGGLLVSLLPQVAGFALWAAIAAYLCLPGIRSVFLPPHS